MEHAKNSVRRPNILPAEMMAYTTAGHFEHLHTRGNSVYLTVLCLVVGGFLSLFFIRVPVTVTSYGMLTPVMERSTVKSPVNGRVQQVGICDDRSVRGVEVLLTLSADAIVGHSDQLDARRRDLAGRLGDLRQLIGLRVGEVPDLTLQSSLYQKQYAYFKQQLAERRL